VLAVRNEARRETVIGQLAPNRVGMAVQLGGYSISEMGGEAGACLHRSINLRG
jgi:hypothetical protein